MRWSPRPPACPLVHPTPGEGFAQSESEQVTNSEGTPSGRLPAQGRLVPCKPVALHALLPRERARTQMMHNHLVRPSGTRYLHGNRAMDARGLTHGPHQLLTYYISLPPDRTLETYTA